MVIFVVSKICKSFVPQLIPLHRPGQPIQGHLKGGRGGAQEGQGGDNGGEGGEGGQHCQAPAPFLSLQSDQPNCHQVHHPQDHPHICQLIHLIYLFYLIHLTRLNRELNSERSESKQ